MQVRTRPHQLPGSTRRKQPSEDGGGQSRQGEELDPPEKPKGSPEVPRVHRVLQILHQRVLSNRQTAARTHQTINPMALECATAMSLQRPEGEDVQKTSLTTTQL